MIFKILKDKKGETIAETLVSSLIAAMSMIIFASMAIASKNVISNSRTIIEQYHTDKSLINTNDSSLSHGDATLVFSEALINEVTDYSTPLYTNKDDEESTKLVIYSY